MVNVPVKRQIVSSMQRLGMWACGRGTAATAAGKSMRQVCTQEPPAAHEAVKTQHNEKDITNLDF